VPDQSAIYFPLRSNAASLMAGQGVAGVRRRLMLASLLHDHVLLEGGTWVATMGPSGGFSIWQPPTGELPPRWQAPRRRGRAQHGDVYVQARSDNAPADAPFHPVVRGPATIAWEATFEPFRRELPAAAAKWITYGHNLDTPEVQATASGWHWADDRDAHLQGLWPNTFIRDLFVKATHLDLAMSAAMGTAVSVDAAHGPVLAARARAGQAQHVYGHRALHLYLPTGFTWDDIANLRRHKAMNEYRAVLRDVEAVALDRAVSLGDVDRFIREVYSGRVASAEARRPAGWARVTVGAIALVAGVAGELATFVPGVGAVTGVAGHEIAGAVAEHASRPRWLAVDTRLRGPRP
jgi:hypothetical protein